MRALGLMLLVCAQSLCGGVLSYVADQDPNLFPDGFGNGGVAEEVWVCDLPGGPAQTGSFFFGTDQSWAIYSTPSATAPALARHTVSQGGVRKVSLEFAHESVAPGRIVEVRIKSGNAILFRLGLVGGAGDYFFSDPGQTYGTGIAPVVQNPLHWSLLLNSDSEYVCAIGSTRIEGSHANLPITEIEILNDCRSSAGAVFFRNLVLQTEETGIAVGNVALNWSSHEAGGEQVQAQPYLKTGTTRESGVHALTVDTVTEYQELDGVGASLSDASAILLNQSMHREEILRRLFDRKEGVGLSLIRLPLGACDFSETVYSYEDTQGQFSIAPDLTHRVPVLREAVRLNPTIRLMAVPWSAPAWMKDSQSMLGGSLLPGMVNEYARYLADILEAYADLGLPIWALSVQNEPEFVTADYPTMAMTAQQQVQVLTALFAEIAQRGLSTEVLTWEHNYDSGEAFVDVVYGDAAVFGLLLGSAWHQYAGNASSMGTIASNYPAKKVFLTERTGQKGNYASNYGYFLGQIFENALNNGSSSLMTWNLALDESGGPRLPTVQVNDLSALLEFDSVSGGYEYWAEFVALGHYAKVAYPGARRLEVTDGHPFQAFRNPDGTIGVVCWNLTNERYSFSLKIGNRYLDDHLQAGQAKSYLIFEAVAPGAFQGGGLEFVVSAGSSGPLVYRDSHFSEFRSVELEESDDFVNWVSSAAACGSLDGYSGEFLLPALSAPRKFYRAKRVYPVLPKGE